MKLPLEALPVGDVTYRNHRESPPGGLQRAEADLDGNLAAVLVPRSALEASPDLPGGDTAHAVRDQDLHRLAHQFLAAVAEQPLALPVDQLDRSS
jgi:hypothetical protein